MNRPAVTKAQIIAALGAGVPVAVNLLAAFGVFAPSDAEQHALTEATKWAVAFAGLLVLGDAHLRGKRNEADAAAAHAARTDAAANAITETAAELRARGARVDQGVDFSRGLDVRSAEPGREFGRAAASAGAAGGPVVDELLEPGDADQMPHFVTSDPHGGRVPPDEVDLGREAEA